MKKSKQQIHYLYFAENNVTQKITLQFENFEGIYILKLGIPVVRERDLNGDVVSVEVEERTRKRVKQMIKHHVTEETVIGAEMDVGRALDMDDVLFQARKYELLEYASWIVSRLRQEINEMGSDSKQRATLMLITKDGIMTRGELYSLLLIMKDYYEELWLGVPDLSESSKDVVKELYEKWGVIVHVVEPDVRQKIDTIIVILDQWEDCGKIRNVQMRKKEQLLCKNMYTTVPVFGGTGSIYFGISYHLNGKEVPYELATNSLIQNHFLCKEFPWNSVAICHMKC